jgi:hypothetical protein
MERRPRTRGSVYTTSRFSAAKIAKTTLVLVSTLKKAEIDGRVTNLG